jgi:predicted nuclease of restriction endonuclease-like (RecB) superfamily
MLQRAEAPEVGAAMAPEQAIKDPFVLEFLNLKDEYSESDFEDALIQHLADFLLELGDDFAFVGRRRRLRIDDSWFRVDLLLFTVGFIACWSSTSRWGGSATPTRGRCTCT